MTTQSQASDCRLKTNWSALPLSRVKTIMRSSPEVSSISPEAIALTAHSAQLFISQLVKDAFNQTNGNTRIDGSDGKDGNNGKQKKGSEKSTLEYTHLSQVVASNARMAFLQDILPEKIKVKEYQKIVKQFEEQNNSKANEEELD